MKTVSNIPIITLASVAATLLLAGCSTGSSEKAAAPAAKVADVKCSGINTCKGTSACATATTSCKGHNSCAGHGWLKMSAAECTAKGGTISGKV